VALTERGAVAGVAAAARGGVDRRWWDSGRPRDGGSGRQQPRMAAAPGRPRDGGRRGSGWASACGKAGERRQRIGSGRQRDGGATPGGLGTAVRLQKASASERACSDVGAA
jgi:hypothetical protein